MFNVQSDSFQVTPLVIHEFNHLSCVFLTHNDSSFILVVILACVASASVGLSAGFKHFSPFEHSKIGASAKKCEKVRSPPRSN